MRSGVVAHLVITAASRWIRHFVRRAATCRAILIATDIEGVLAMATQAAHALGVVDGVLHTEIKLTPAGPRIIEVNGRVGGGISRMMTRVGGPNMLETAIRIALGLDIATDWLGDRPAVSFFRWIHGPDRRVRLIDVDGLAEIGQLPGVEAVRLNRMPGAEVDPAEGGLGHIVALEGVVGSHGELAELLAAIGSRLRIEVE